MRFVNPHSYALQSSGFIENFKEGIVAGLSRRPFVWILALLWVALHVVGYSYVINSGATQAGGFNIGGDLNIYRGATERLWDNAPVYPLTPEVLDRETFLTSYPYHPFPLLLLTPMVSLPNATLYPLFALFLVITYLIGLWVWYRVMREMQLSFVLVGFLLSVITYDFLGNVAYTNIGPALVLLSGLSALLLVRGQGLFAGLIAAVILTLKPQYTFPLLLPLLMREHRVFIRAVAGTVIFYAVLNGIFMLTVGVDRGVEVIRDYWQYSLGLSARIPWQGTEAMFNTLQHSFYQTFFRYTDDPQFSGTGALILQTIVVITTLVCVFRARAVRTKTAVFAALMCGYITAKLMLPLLEESLMAGVIAAFLWNRAPLARLYVVYALLEIPSLILLVLGVENPYIFTMIPTNLILLVLLYVLLVRTTLQERAPETARQLVEQRT
jgi:hypothetical protein